MVDTFALEVVTPEKVLLAAAATSLSLRTSGGSLAVLPGHAPLVGDVLAGEVRIERPDAEPLRLAVHGGFVQVETARGAADGFEGVGDGPISGVSTRVTLLVGVAELSDDIDVPRAEAARSDAQARLDSLRGGAAEDGSVDRAQAAAQGDLARAELRLEVAGVSIS